MHAKVMAHAAGGRCSTGSAMAPASRSASVMATRVARPSSGSRDEADQPLPAHAGDQAASPAPPGRARLPVGGTAHG